MSKMRQISAIINALLLFYAAVAFPAEPRITISPKWPQLNVESRECGGFSDDSLILKIKDNGKEIIHEFCSSYGKADAKITKDALGDNFLILKCGHGRGTNAVSEYLSVFRLDKNLIEYVRIPISEGAGPNSRWYYDYEIERPKEGGLIITLTLRIERTDAEWYPKEEKRTIQIK